MDHEALRALMLQMEWGADEALAEEPLMRLAQGRRQEPLHTPPGRTPPGPPRPARVAPPAASACPEIDSLEALRNAIATFEGCALSDTATGPVLVEGEGSSGLLVIYGPPSDDDDRAGRPMSGPAGKFFDAMLASIDLPRSAVLLAPLVPWRPPGGRPPSPSELGLCLPFLHRLIGLARPRLVLLMAAQASRALLGPERRARGEAVRAEVPGLVAPIRCMTVAGPDELLRNPDQRQAAWAALRRAKRLLQRSTPDCE